MRIPRTIQTLLKAPTLNNSPMQRLCRVLKGPGCYVCGLCGKRYNSLNNAWRCLTNDGLSITSSPVIATYSDVQTYFCLLCGKTYVYQEDTALCTLRDLKVAQFPKVLGDHLHSLFAALAEGGEKTKRDFLVRRQKALEGSSTIPTNQVAYKAPPPSKKSISKPAPKQPQLDEPAEKEQNLMLTQEPDIQEGPEKKPDTLEDPIDHKTDINQQPQATEKPALYRKPGQMPFSRDNAQYRCTVCKEKFFTKTEAETHFLEHPLMDEA